MFSRTARDLAELMNTIDVEQHRLEAHYQTYLRTITQSDPFVSDLVFHHQFKIIIFSRIKN
jgi:hypothetical protein